MRKPMIIAGLAAAALVVGGGVAYAGAQDEAPSSTGPAPAISQQQAEKTALDKVPGAKVTSTELESEDGTQVWEVDLTGTDGVEHEVEVDAAQGTVLKTETDSGKGEDETTESGRDDDHGQKGADSRQHDNENDNGQEDD